MQQHLIDGHRSQIHTAQEQLERIQEQLRYLLAQAARPTLVELECLFRELFVYEQILAANQAALDAVAG